MKKLKYVTGATLENAPTKRELAHRALARRAAQQGIVLLQNKGDALPIAPGSLAVYGAGASMTVKGGTGSGEVNERYTVTILQGLENAGFTVTTKQWIADFEGEYDRAKQAYAERKAKTSLLQFGDVINIMNDPLMLPAGRVVTDADIEASGTDTALYIVARQAGEGTDKKLDKGEFDLMPEEKESLRKLAASYKKTILVINSGAQMDLSILDEIDISAVLYFCQQGEEGGNALADVLTGKVSPSGKLVDTWAKKYTDIPFANEYSYLSGDTTQEYYKEGIYVGYRYFDTFHVAPRWPFGFGLSYTEFTLTAGTPTMNGAELSLPVTVENIGKAAGHEVVQIYVSAQAGELDKERKRLVAFAKTEELVPGAAETLTLHFSMKDCTSYDEKAAAFVLEAGNYLVQVGTSGADVASTTVVEVAEKQVVTRCKNVCEPAKTITELTAPKREAAEIDPAVPHLTMQPFAPETVQYAKPSGPESAQVKAILDTFTAKEMAQLCVGAGYGCMMKADKISTLGCIGKTTDALCKKGLLGVNLSDGPAGLRISQGSAVKRGKVKTLQFVMSFMEFFPGFMKKMMLADPQKDELLYQFCTAFPVGTALAQTWNTALCEEVGRAIGTEMNEYLVTYWLAPAMNIHRNPLCGRNFEYYSEDPVVSGKIAAALVRGVQSFPGTYATIKHFAANNQEDNRNKSNSNLDERTLREIYLRGFEICVKEAHPASLMSSYNKINGIYSPNCGELLTDVLRNEWGFDGMVMTDWYSTGNGLGTNDGAIKAGNDLIMPGMPANAKEILAGLKNGTITEEELRLSAGRIARQILASNVAAKHSPDQFV